MRLGKYRLSEITVGTLFLYSLKKCLKIESEYIYYLCLFFAKYNVKWTVLVVLEMYI